MLVMNTFKKWVKDSDSKIPCDRVYGKIYSNLGKKMGGKSGNIQVGNFTEKSAKTTKVKIKGYNYFKEKKIQMFFMIY